MLPSVFQASNLIRDTIARAVSPRVTSPLDFLFTPRVLYDFLIFSSQVVVKTKLRLPRAPDLTETALFGPWTCYLSFAVATKSLLKLSDGGQLGEGILVTALASPLARP